MFKIFALLLITTIPLLTGCVTAVATGAIVGTNMVSDRRTPGIYIEDQAIELKATEALLNDPALKASSSISVTSFNRIVLLVGQSPSQQLRDSAAEIVRKIANIRKIHNEIRISAPSSLLSATNDSWLTTKAKSLMLAKKKFASGHIKVVTENGEIFLMGMVTRAEAEQAISIVRNINGVERVVQVFEYIH